MAAGASNDALVIQTARLQHVVFLFWLLPFIRLKKILPCQRLGLAGELDFPSEILTMIHTKYPVEACTIATQRSKATP